MSFRTSLVVVALVACATFLSAAAGAHDHSAVKLQGQPQTVATAVTPDGRTISLVAQDSDRGICLTVSGASLPVQSCGPAPQVALLDAQTAQSGYAIGSQPTQTYLFGVVSAATASLEFRLRGGGTQTVATTDGGYTGRYHGKARFFLAAIAGNHPPYYTRALGSDGAVLAAAEDQTAVRPSRGPVEVNRGRVAGHRFSFSAVIKRLLAPTVGQPERRADELCVRLDQSPAAPVGGSAAGSCGPTADSDDLDGAYSQYRPGRHCSNANLFMWGTVKPSSRRVSLRLSNGSVIAAPTVDVRRKLRLSRRVFALATASAGAYPVEFDVFAGSGRRTTRFRFGRIRIPASRSGCSAVYGAFGESSGGFSGP